MISKEQIESDFRILFFFIPGDFGLGGHFDLLYTISKRGFRIYLMMEKKNILYIWGKGKHCLC